MMFSGNAILEEIRRLHGDKETGVLALTGAGGERLDIFFREGMIEAASSQSGSVRLGDYLVRGGHVAARELEAVCAEAQRHKIFFGEAIVRKSLADQAYVGAAARSQSMDLLERALTGGFAVDCFTPSLRSYFAPARISFHHMILELARGSAAALESELETSFVARLEMDLSLFPWHPEEIFVLRKLKHPSTLRDLLASTGFNEELLKKILGVLMALGVIETANGPEEWRTDHSLEVRKSEFAFEDLIPVVADAVLSEKLDIASGQRSFAEPRAGIGFAGASEGAHGVESRTTGRKIIRQHQSCIFFFKRPGPASHSAGLRF